jgi:hypothetical protein
VAFNILYIYDFITKLRRQQAEVMQNHHNTNFRSTGQGEAQRRKYKRLKLGGRQPLEVTELPSKHRLSYDKA